MAVNHAKLTAAEKREIVQTMRDANDEYPGIWKKFYTERSRLHKSGKTAKESHIEAMELAYKWAKGDVVIEKDAVDDPFVTAGDAPLNEPMPDLPKASLADFPGMDEGDVDYRKACEMVGKYLYISDVTPQDILKILDPPTAAMTWTLLRWATDDNNKHLNEFVKNILPKAMPTKSQIEEGEKRFDDGRQIFKILDRVEKAENKQRNAVLPSSPQGLDTQH